MKIHPEQETPYFNENHNEKLFIVTYFNLDQSNDLFIKKNKCRIIYIM